MRQAELGKQGALQACCHQKKHLVCRVWAEGQSAGGQMQADAWPSRIPEAGSSRLGHAPSPGSPTTALKWAAAPPAACSLKCLRPSATFWWRLRAASAPTSARGAKCPARLSSATAGTMHCNCAGCCACRAPPGCWLPPPVSSCARSSASASASTAQRSALNSPIVSARARAGRWAHHTAATECAPPPMFCAGAAAPRLACPLTQADEQRVGAGALGVHVGLEGRPPDRHQRVHSVLRGAGQGRERHLAASSHSAVTAQPNTNQPAGMDPPPPTACSHRHQSAPVKTEASCCVWDGLPTQLQRCHPFNPRAVIGQH